MMNLAATTCAQALSSSSACVLMLVRKMLAETAMDKSKVTTRADDKFV
jgi:hypothetical protein